MALSGDTGNGATLTLPSGYSVALIDITPGKKTLAMIDSSTLATTGTRERIPGDLNDVASFTARFKWVPTVAEPTLGTVGTCTITLPLYGALTNAATYSGTGCITGWMPPKLANGELMAGEVTVDFDGDTGPTYTVAS